MLKLLWLSSCLFCNITLKIHNSRQAELGEKKEKKPNKGGQKE
jgi:hypothetical protein